MQRKVRSLLGWAATGAVAVTVAASGPAGAAPGHAAAASRSAAATRHPDAGKDRALIKAIFKRLRRKLVGPPGPAGPTGPAGPLGTAGGDLAGSFPSPSVRDGAITIAKLADGAVTLAKMAANAVGTDQIVDGAVTNAKIAPGAVGISRIGTVPSARAESAGPQAVAPTTVETIAFPGESYDTADLHSTAGDTARLTAPVTGIYDIAGAVRWASEPNGSRYVGITVNAVAIASVWERANLTNTDQTLSGQTRLNAGDVVRLSVYQNSPTSLGVGPASLAMTWIAPATAGAVGRRPGTDFAPPGDTG